ncbi:MAG: hypothetical protein AAGJ93_15285, partial [Bacteroidota bacterium]
PLGYTACQMNGNTMLMGGNVQQFPMGNTFYDVFDNCNPMLSPSAQPTLNSIRVEVADFVSVPYRTK